MKTWKNMECLAGIQTGILNIDTSEIHNQGCKLPCFILSYLWMELIQIIKVYLHS